MDVLARCLFAHETSGANLAFMDAVELWGVRVSTYSNDILARNHRYEYVAASRLRLSIGAQNMQTLMRKSKTAAWEQLRLAQISSGAALHAPLDVFNAVLPAAQFHLPSAFAIPSNRTTRYFEWAVQDHSNDLDGITFPHRFFNAARWEILPHVIEHLVAEFAAR